VRLKHKRLRGQPEQPTARNTTLLPIAGGTPLDRFTRQQRRTPHQQAHGAQASGMVGSEVPLPSVKIRPSSPGHDLRQVVV
jgi:hypothetical protein